MRLGAILIHAQHFTEAMIQAAGDRRQCKRLALSRVHFFILHLLLFDDLLAARQRLTLMVV